MKKFFKKTKVATDAEEIRRIMGAYFIQFF